MARGCATAAVLALPALDGCAAVQPETDRRTPTPTSIPADLRHAMHYQPLDDGSVQCRVCFRQCIIAEGRLGFCSNRKNIAGRLYSLIHGRPCALQVDPIEKEPVFHMLPGSTIFCVGTASCNSRCKFCQNWEMSQQTMWETVNYRATPTEVIGGAEVRGCQAVSFTYNEPTVFYEYVHDIAQAAKVQGLYAVCHTNGTMQEAPLAQMLELMDAVTVDLKAFTADFYRRVCSLELEPVLSSIQRIALSGVHLEIVNLIIPTLNDDVDDLRRLCLWLVDNVGPAVPVHFTRFFPAYKMQHLSPTPIETLEEAASIADESGLQFVYLGNVPGHERNSTFCPQCGQRIIHRLHFAVVGQDMVGGRCGFCGRAIPGVWAA